MSRSIALSVDPMPPAWGPRERQSLWDRLRDPEKHELWDLVVVGAGITGAGLARDAAMRGLRVLVLEASDLAFGTSSRSSRLIHGGVRYLEQAELGLVFEALRERTRLYTLAPHLVRPARFLFPTYVGDRLGPWRLRLGLTLYDTLNLFRGQGHRFVRPEETRELVPLLEEKGLLGAVEYEDAVTDDARLTLTNLQDARRHGAEVLSYAEVDRIEARDGQHVLVLTDGTAVHTHCAIVATGPWTGERLLGTAGHRLLALSKGIHIVMRTENISVTRPVVVQAPEQRRILFVVPWGNRTYLGTTDTAYDGDPGDSGVTVDDERELLGLVGRIFTGASLDREAIVSAWSGVRPLVRPPGAADDTVELSRTHRIVENEDGVLGIVGGKLTTFRAMAEETLDRALRRLPHAAIGACKTAERALVPGEALSGPELADPLLADLAHRHGPLSRELARRVTDQPALGERLIEDLPYRWVEVEHALTHEGCTHLDDLLRRRLPVALTDAGLGGSVARRVATMLVDARGGSQKEIDEELERYRYEMVQETRREPAL